MAYKGDSPHLSIRGIATSIRIIYAINNYSTHTLMKLNEQLVTLGQEWTFSQHKHNKEVLNFLSSKSIPLNPTAINGSLRYDKLCQCLLFVETPIVDE